MAWHGKGSTAGFLDPAWSAKQAISYAPETRAQMVNPTLVGIPHDQLVNKLVSMPAGIFVQTLPTTMGAGGFRYSPSFHGSPQILPSINDLARVYDVTRQDTMTADHRYALNIVPKTLTDPLELMVDTHINSQIVNTGYESFVAGNHFEIVRPTAEDSKAQIDAAARNTKFQHILKMPNPLVGGFAATRLIPAEESKRIKYVVGRETDLAVDFSGGAPNGGAGANAVAIRAMYETAASLGNPVQKQVLLTTIDAMEYFYYSLLLARRLADLGGNTMALMNNYIAHKHNGGNLDPNTLIAIWRDGVVADLFKDGVQKGLDLTKRYRSGTHGVIMRNNDANPTPRGTETVYNAYSGHSIPGDTMIGAIFSFNGY
ncbi:capsid triplex subunit 2 [Anguillid herpesvirus 1]|uniref:Capsid triplex protein 2 n=1 Tax=Anguillid herpesvirus 1 TaxID=150286 RepID=E5DCU4_9VIRU|nr:capsid triplex subunit 2 [Anguillid herpesvirus 1]ADA57799.1 capsid triplex subunit 2 [Anguillid herpesvirus 1]ADQ54118.1 capsid triplex protein 2 [Anguillid herpesvirus 1]APD76199.1 capsid triplex subunit 2 [Anguillid herpesvirus 1]QRM16329.1 capsid triplex subunit 2 [Anguillid herpesvirus 1]QRM16459.1 capsid triplex subunit 2 [Anguillid herpesvirus 1]